jgi:hypothetical protein
MAFMAGGFTKVLLQKLDGAGLQKFLHLIRLLAAKLHL